MDAEIADTTNRRDAWRIAKHLDLLDYFCGIRGNKTPAAGAPWYRSNMAETLLADGPDTNSDRAWLLGALAIKTPGLTFDGVPADCDWPGMFSWIRFEITCRRNMDAHDADCPAAFSQAECTSEAGCPERDPEIPQGEVGADCLAGVV